MGGRGSRRAAPATPAARREPRPPGVSLAPAQAGAGMAAPARAGTGARPYRGDTRHASRVMGRGAAGGEGGCEGWVRKWPRTALGPHRACLGGAGVCALPPRGHLDLALDLDPPPLFLFRPVGAALGGAAGVRRLTPPATLCRRFAAPDRALRKTRHASFVTRHGQGRGGGGGGRSRSRRKEDGLAWSRVHSLALDRTLHAA